MNVLILGAGGREHALALALAKSPLLGKLFVAPGQSGLRRGRRKRRAGRSTITAAIVDFCRSREVGLVVVGPEAPLVAGVADDLAAAGILCFGPSKAAARLEGSKGFTKDFCREFGIPTGDYRRFARRGVGARLCSRQGRADRRQGRRPRRRERASSSR